MKAEELKTPGREQAPQVNASVGQQPVHLFDAVLALGASGHRQRLTDDVHRQARGVDDALAQRLPARKNEGMIQVRAYFRRGVPMNCAGLTGSGNPAECWRPPMSFTIPTGFWIFKAASIQTTKRKQLFPCMS